MQQVIHILRESLIYRFCAMLAAACGRQWHKSRIVSRFLSPSEHDRAISESSVFYKLFLLLRRGLSAVYRALRLDKLLSGSVFLRLFIWTALAVFLSPLIPTMATLGIAAAGYFSLLVSLLRDPARQLSFSPMNKYILLYAVIYVAGTVFSVTLSGSLRVGLLTVAFVLFALVLQNAVENRRQLDILIRGVVISGAVVSLYGIYQYLFRAGYQSAAWIDNDLFSTIQFRVASTLQNPNMLGQYLLLTIPLGAALLLRSKSWGSAVIWLACCAVMCLCMLLTFARGAWLGLVFAAAVFAIMLNPRLVFLVPVLVPVLLAVLYFALPPAVVERFTSIGDMTDKSTSYRVYIWLGTLDMLKDYWLCGIGPGEAAFNLVYPAYSFSTIVAPHSHNLLLQIVCDAGVTALLVFGAILFHYFRGLCAAIRHAADKTSRVMQIAAVSAMGGFLVQAMTDYSFYNYRVMFIFWVFIALGALLVRRDKMPEGTLRL